jgi:hypothetical protein
MKDDKLHHIYNEGRLALPEVWGGMTAFLFYVPPFFYDGETSEEGAKKDA